MAVSTSNSPAAGLMELQECEDPIELFQDWFSAACDREVSDPTAMALATADARGVPNVRIVLFKRSGEDGFVFYSNSQSIKGEELKANPQVALCMHWKSIRRQIRVQGVTAPVDNAEADAYFRTRPRDSQIGAWASEQSRELSGRPELEQALRDVEARFDGRDVDRPPHWTGFCVRPLRIEFWREREFRLHDRKVFERSNPDDTNWRSKYLYP